MRNMNFVSNACSMKFTRNLLCVNGGRFCPRRSVSSTKKTVEKHTAISSCQSFHFICKNIRTRNKNLICFEEILLIRSLPMRDPKSFWLLSKPTSCTSYGHISIRHHCILQCSNILLKQRVHDTCTGCAPWSVAELT